jgi:FlgD Ig-like domain
MLALLAGTATAFALTEALKLDRTPIARPKFDVSFSPVCDCRRERARLPVRFRSQQTVDAVVVDGDGNPIRSLETGTRHPRGRFVYIWDGRDDDGAVVPDGSYRLRLSFDSDGRTIELPNEIRVDTEPPSLQVQRVLQDPLTVVASSNERARLLLLLDGRIDARGSYEDSGPIRVVTDSDLLGALSVMAEDAAGNRSQPVELDR